MNFHKQRVITPESMVLTIIKLKEDSVVLNNVTKFHKILIKTILIILTILESGHRLNGDFLKQRAVASGGMVRYGPLSNLKQTSWYSTM